MRIFLISLALLLFGMNLSGQITHSLEAIQDSLTVQLLHYPQEKLYLHTDRTMYMPGEKIWFRAYLIDAFSHHPLTYSLYIYVELIDSTQTIKKRVMIRREENGIYHGQLPVPEKITSGTYTIRAYTRFLENLGDDYFFKKNSKRLRDAVLTERKSSPTFAAENKTVIRYESIGAIRENIARLSGITSCPEIITIKIL